MTDEEHMKENLRIWGTPGVKNPLTGEWYVGDDKFKIAIYTDMNNAIRNGELVIYKKK